MRFNLIANNNSKILENINPLNWSPSTKKTLLKLCLVSAVTYCALSVIQNMSGVDAKLDYLSNPNALKYNLTNVPEWPTSWFLPFPNSYQYNCSLSASENAVMAADQVKHYDTWAKVCLHPYTASHAENAYNIIYKLGKLWEEGIKTGLYTIKSCQFLADTLPPDPISSGQICAF